MIIALAVAIGILAVLLCLLWLLVAKYKRTIRDNMDSTFSSVVLMKSFDQFKSLYDIAPEKYRLNGSRYHPYIAYTTKVKRTISMGMMDGMAVKRDIYNDVTYELYFENLSDWIQANRLLKDRDRNKRNAEVEENQLRRQKEFIEHVRKDLDIFEKKGIANE